MASVVRSLLGAPGGLIDAAHCCRARAWLFVLPALVLVALSALVPLMTVVNYSLHVLMDGCPARYNGLENYSYVLGDWSAADIATWVRNGFWLVVVVVNLPVVLAVNAWQARSERWWIPSLITVVLVNGGLAALWFWLSCAQFAGASGEGADFSMAIMRQVWFTLTVLLVEIPLGLVIALCLPRRGWGLTASLVLLGLPLLIPWTVVGLVWKVFTCSLTGPLPTLLGHCGYEYLPGTSIADAWWTTVAMDVWHWTPLVALLCLAGLKTIPEPCYRAAAIDGASAWATFRHVVLPRLRYVLILAVLLRTMDSFNIYTEPRILTGGGPGTATTFVSIYVDRFTMDKGLLSAMSILYLFLIVMSCYVLYTIMQNLSRGAREA